MSINIYSHGSAVHRMRGNTIRPGHRWPADKPDVRHMSLADRQQLEGDSPLAIIACNQYVCALPIKLFRAMSKLEGEIDMDHRNGPAFFLPDIEGWPIQEIIAWFQQLVKKEEYAHLDIMRDNNGELCTCRDLSLVRAGRLLGMQLYTHEMFNVYVKHVQSGRISFEDVDAIVRLSLKKNDPLLQHLGARLGRMMRCENPKEIPPWLEEIVEGHPWLKRWVDEELDRQDSLTQVEDQRDAKVEKKSRSRRTRRSRKN